MWFQVVTELFKRGVARYLTPARKTALICVLAVWIGAEATVMIMIGRSAGYVWVILLILAGLIIGPGLIPAQIASVLRGAAQSRQAPGKLRGSHDSVLGRWATPDSTVLRECAVALVAGILVMIPGVISLVVGLVLSLTPVRRGVARIVGRRSGRRQGSHSQVSAPNYPDVVETTATDVTPGQLGSDFR